MEIASQRQDKTSDLAERPKMTPDPVIHVSYRNRRCGVALRAPLAQRFALSDISRHLVAAIGSALGRSGMKVKLNDRLPQIREGGREARRRRGAAGGGGTDDKETGRAAAKGGRARRGAGATAVANA